MKYFACILILLFSNVALACPGGGPCGCDQPVVSEVDVNTLTAEVATALRENAMKVLSETDSAAGVVIPTVSVLPHIVEHLRSRGATDEDVQVFVDFVNKCKGELEGAREQFIKSVIYAQYGDAQEDTPEGNLRAALAYLQAITFCEPLLKKLKPLAEEAKAVQEHYYKLKEELSSEDKSA